MRSDLPDRTADRTGDRTAGRVAEELVAAGLVDPARRRDAESVVARALEPEGPARAAPRPEATRTLLVEIAGYAGGALVVASVGLFLAREWNRLSQNQQTASLALVTLVLVAAGLLVSRVGGGYAEVRDGRDEIRRRLTSALLTAGAVAAGVTVGHAVSALLDDPFSNWPGVAGGATAAVLAATGYGYAPSALGQLVLAGAGLDTVVTGWTLADADQSSMLGPGLTVLALGVVWLVAAERGAFRERTVARVVGSAVTLLGAQLPAFDGDHNNAAYALLALTALAAFAAYLRVVAWPYLVAGVVGVTLVVPEAVIDWTEGSLGVAGGVLVAGLTLLGASLAGLRMRRESRFPR